MPVTVINTSSGNPPNSLNYPHSTNPVTDRTLFRVEYKRKQGYVHEEGLYMSKIKIGINVG